MKNRLNKTQKAAVESFGSPVLIFAGAGSGKTRVLTHKIVHLIEKKLIKAENILALTFTNKAAKEMQYRIERLVKKDGALVTMGTFHSICAKILRNEIHHLGYGTDFSIFDIQDQISLIKVILVEMKISKNEVSPQEVRNQISLYKNKLITPSIAKRKSNLVIEKTYAEIYNNYQKSLFNNNAVDFDDLLLLPLQLFDNNQEILEKYRHIWQYVLVDEYQDTNKPQFMLIKLLAEKHKQVCVVGDGKKYLSALVVLDADGGAEKWSEENGIAYDLKNLSINEKVISAIQEQVDEANSKVAQVQQIKKFVILDNEWTDTSGELTPTLKLKRNVINEKYNQEIESMYEGDE